MLIENAKALKHQDFEAQLQHMFLQHTKTDC